MEPTVERFRALARSSPWRWSTLRYVQHQSPSGRDQEPVRVLVRRPKLARVERLDGTLLRVIREAPQTVVPLSREGSAGPVELPGAGVATVDLDADGFLRRRPDRFHGETDTAMIHNYCDVAMLDPAELADGHDDGPGVTIDDLRVVEHHGREAWEAILRPTATYDPRCSCCSLLLSELTEDNGIDPRAEDPAVTYPDARRVRIDVGTGICVANAQLGGTHDGTGHHIAIETVDDPMGDELFPLPERSRWSRFLRRS